MQKSYCFLNSIKCFKAICLLILLAICGTAGAADDFVFRGKVLDSQNDKPVPMAIVRISQLNLWTISDNDGAFSIPKIKAGRYPIDVTVLGYNTKLDTVDIPSKEKEVVVYIDHQSLKLKEVTVTAKEQRSGSTSKIDANAIQHLQPKSIEDLLQLVPGGITKNPDLNNVGQAQIREIGNNSDNALGTAIVVDGAPLSNDANMQSVSTARNGVTTNSYDEQGTSGRGVDLRILSPDNVESMEVIRGIPSVEYGNMTSGALVIKTKSGYTPLEVKAKVDPNSKMFYAGKGFDLKGNGGNVNLSADYSQSYDDIRKRYVGYDRFTMSASYANKFFTSTHPLTFKVTTAFFTTLNSRKNDPQFKERERVKNEQTGARLGLESKWRLDLPWISTASFNAMLSYMQQKDYRLQRVYLQAGVTPISESLVSGEFETRFLQAAYYSEYTITGKPMDFFAQLKGEKVFQMSNGAFNNIKAGVEYRFNKNYGEGMKFDILFPPSVNENQSIRPRAYSDVPALNQLTGFIEDKWHQPVGNMAFTLQAGSRFTNMFIEKERALRGDIFAVEPRVNLELNILNRRNNSFFDDLSLSGGYGITTKMPTMLYLYPDKAYFDATSLAVMSDNIAMAVATTKVIDNTANKDLKATVNHKIEATLSGRHRKMSFNITFFAENSNNDFGFKNVPVITPYRHYNVPAGMTSIEYDNGVYYTLDGVRQAATFRMDTTFNTYLTPSNRVTTRKRGIEYSVNLGEISAIKTSVVIDGAYLWIKRKSNETSNSAINTMYQGGYYPYMPVFAAGSGSVNDRFNTNFRFITHLNKLGLIFSTTAQVIWRQTSKDIYEDSHGNSRYYHEVNSQTGPDGFYYVDPIGFYDRRGDYHEWHESYRTDNTYSQMRSGHTANPDSYARESLPTTILFNFRLTKEMGKMLEVSFLANNFLKFSKYYKHKTYNGYSQLYTPMYFGAELKLKL